MNLEDAVVQLTRLGLRGDATSVAQYAKRLLRDFAKDGQVSAKTLDALAQLVAAAPTAVARFVEPSPAESDPRLVDVVPPGNAAKPLLEPEIAAHVDDVVREHEHQAELEAARLQPTRTMLFTGPPGVGKTITARWIASRLGVPLFRLDLSTLMSSYLGRSAQNLRSALTQARSVPSVMLLDEFDAIGKRRDDPGDVGELKRIVNVLLLELEGWPTACLLIAATNHPELLDRAVWRRFERVVQFGLPTAPTRRALFERELNRHDRAASARTLEACVAATAGASGSDIATLTGLAIRRSVLTKDRDIDVVLIDSIVERLLGAARDGGDARRLFCEICASSLGMTQREIAGRLGISHVAVGKVLRATRNEEAAKQEHGRRNHD